MVIPEFLAKPGDLVCSDYVVTPLLVVNTYKVAHDNPHGGPIVRWYYILIHSDGELSRVSASNWERVD